MAGSQRAVDILPQLTAVQGEIAPDLSVPHNSRCSEYLGLATDARFSADNRVARDYSGIGYRSFIDYSGEVEHASTSAHDRIWTNKRRF
jgi:hypothetical protein